jgi:cytochrome d ubiquinol oxidase subunit II
VTCAYLAAIYLTNDASDSPELQEDFRLRGIIAGILLGVLGVIAIPVTRADASHMWEGLAPGGPASILMSVAALSLAASLVLLFVRRYWYARAAAIAQVTLTFAAWAVAQYPYLLVPDITIQGCRLPPVGPRRHVRTGLRLHYRPRPVPVFAVQALQEQPATAGKGRGVLSS